MPEKDEIVRSLSRGLAVLRYINGAGQARAGEIAAALNLPRPTVYRLLHTLEEEGYIAHSSSDSRVRVTRYAAGLGDGYKTTSAVCRAAAPVLAEYGAKVVWPIDLSVYDNGHMVIQETTHERSPLSIDRGMIGYPLPMLRSSAGRAYLAYCDRIERAAILKQVRAENEAEDKPFLDKDYLADMLNEIVLRGVAFRDARTFRPKTASIALPVMVNDTIVACVSIIWTSRAMTIEEARKGYEKPLREIASAISAAMEDLS